jgi:hypothetical protein
MDTQLICKRKEDRYIITEPGYGQEKGSPVRLSLREIFVIPLGRTHWAVGIEDSVQGGIRYGSVQGEIASTVRYVYDDKSCALRVAYDLAEQQGQVLARERGCFFSMCPPQV